MIRMAGYKVDKKVGQGGVAAVYSSMQLRDGRQAALKILRLRFRGYIQIQKRLSF